VHSDCSLSDALAALAPYEHTTREAERRRSGKEGREGRGRRSESRGSHQRPAGSGHTDLCPAGRPIGRTVSAATCYSEFRRSALERQNSDYLQICGGRSRGESFTPGRANPRRGHLNLMACSFSAARPRSAAHPRPYEKTHHLRCRSPGRQLFVHLVCHPKQAAAPDYYRPTGLEVIFTESR
jgi:hypothetical protein